MPGNKEEAYNIGITCYYVLNVNTLAAVQGFAWERWETHVEREVLYDSADLQLRMVRCPWLPLRHPINYFVGVLDISPFGNGPSNWVRQEWAWFGLLFPWLDHHCLFPWQPTCHSLLRNRQYHRRLHPIDLPPHPCGILGTQSLQCQELPHLLFETVHCQWPGIQCDCHCERQVWDRHAGVLGTRSHQHECVLLCQLWYWLCCHCL